jgi:hypothetical protein
MPDGIIRDPVHNERQCRYGIVWVEDEGGVLAVYDKDKLEGKLLHLPSGWKLSGNLTPFQRKNDKGDEITSLRWCNIDISYEFDVTIDNPGGHGPIAWHFERHARGHLHFQTDAYDPVNTGGIIYPEPEE